MVDDTDPRRWTSVKISALRKPFAHDLEHFFRRPASPVSQSWHESYFQRRVVLLQGWQGALGRAERQPTNAEQRAHIDDEGPKNCGRKGRIAEGLPQPR